MSQRTVKNLSEKTPASSKCARTIGIIVSNVLTETVQGRAVPATPVFEDRNSKIILESRPSFQVSGGITGFVVIAASAATMASVGNLGTSDGCGPPARPDRVFHGRARRRTAPSEVGSGGAPEERGTGVLAQGGWSGTKARVDGRFGRFGFDLPARPTEDRSAPCLGFPKGCSESRPESGARKADFDLGSRNSFDRNEGRSGRESPVARRSKIER
jgi:hypothetical protein